VTGIHHRTSLTAHRRTALRRSACSGRWVWRWGFLYRDSCRWKVTSVGRDLVAGDGLAHRDTEPLVEADRGGVSRRCDRWKLATSEGTHALDERSVQRSRESTVRRSGRSATGGLRSRASLPSPTPSCATRTVARVRSRRRRSAVPRRRSTADPAGAARRGRPPRGAARLAAGHRGRRAVSCSRPGRHRISRRYRGAEVMMGNAA
jgi:hypothetical protein